MQYLRQTSWLAASVVWALTVFVVTLFEWPRICEFGLLDLVVSWDPETTFPTLILLMLPVLAFLFPAKRRSHQTKQNLKNLKNLQNDVGCLVADSLPKQVPVDSGHTNFMREKSRLRITVGLALQTLTIVLCSLLSSWWIGQSQVDVRTASGAVQQVPLAELPHAYHDEFSYLLQAQTYTARRLAWPAVPAAPDLFHQFHVLNEDATVSRYFPLTGAWIVPSLALGHPIWGHWVAGALSAMFFFWCARMMMAARPAFLSGLLLALSPSLAIFSNMLLAHHPVMFMLSVFLFAFLKMLQPDSDGQRKLKSIVLMWSLIAGCGLSAAMLGRPMTAAGFAAPFGAWLLWTLIGRRIPAIVILGFALPLIGGFCILAATNAAATADPFRTAYQEYTDNFTPRHKFGFDNAVGCEIAAGPEAVRKYDQWAQNLDWAKAAGNFKLRFKFSLLWTWNLTLLSLGLISAIVELFKLGGPQRLASLTTLPDQAGSQVAFRFTALAMVLAAIVSLHVVHIPYWYSGIMEWHYVFETAPLILLLSAFGLFSFVGNVKRIMRSGLVTTCVCGLLLVSIIPGWVDTPDVLGTSKVSGWISQISFSRRRIAEFHSAVEAASAEQATLIFVDETGTDPQLSYIINPPDYAGRSLVCRLPRTPEELKAVQAAFPNRQLYYFAAQNPTAAIRPFDIAIHGPK